MQLPYRSNSLIGPQSVLFCGAEGDSIDDESAPPRNAMLLLLHALVAAVETPELATASSPEIRRAQLVRVSLAKNCIIWYRIRVSSMLAQTPNLSVNNQYMNAMHFLVCA